MGILVSGVVIANGWCIASSRMAQNTLNFSGIVINVGLHIIKPMKLGWRESQEISNELKAQDLAFKGIFYDLMRLSKKPERELKTGDCDRVVSQCFRDNLTIE